jgi:hypothetical protein
MASTVAPAEQFAAPLNWQTAEMTAMPKVDRLKAITLGDDRDFALLQAETAGLSLQELRKLLSESNERVLAPSCHAEAHKCMLVPFLCRSLCIADVYIVSCSRNFFIPWMAETCEPCPQCRYVWKPVWSVWMTDDT